MALSERQNVVSENLVDSDAGLFRSGIVQIAVEVTPYRRRSPNGDLVLRGFIENKEIEVVFPGRRQVEAAPLLTHLQQQAKVVKRSLDGADRLAVVGNTRQKLRIDGVWRVRLLAEENGMPVRRFQLVAARWRYRGANGVEHLCGHLPNG